MIKQKNMQNLVIQNLFKNEAETKQPIARRQKKSQGQVIESTDYLL